MVYLDKQEEKFKEIEQSLREKAREKGRKDAEKVFLGAISPNFKRLRYNPYDIKPILNPVDFVVFKGMEEKKSVSDVCLLSKVSQNAGLNSLRKQVKKTVEKKEYEWQTARIDEKGKIEFE